MATALDRFRRSNVGSSNKYVDFDSKISPSGDFERITNLEVIIRSWKRILIIGTESYDHDPAFGSDLKEYIFAPVDEETQEKIRDEVFDKLTTYDDRADIENIDVRFLNNMRGFVINITANYQGESFSIQQTVDESLYG